MLGPFVRLVATAVFVLATVSTEAAGVVSTPTVRLANGATITGTSQLNVAGKQVNVFRGIPYAEPPVGERRWKQTKLKTITSNINATAYGSICFGNPTYDAASGEFPNSEDCLFINVYTPASATPTSKLPVMVWVHGGAFVAGASNPYNGSNIIAAASDKAVIVTFNYRLGIFGFLSNKEILAEADGANFGLRDQEIAFAWMKQYVQYFGGNPNDITAAGQSAGSMSIAMHMISRTGNQKLFHKSILESGVHTSAHDTTSVSLQAKYTNTTATGVGCAGANDVLQCLRHANASAIFAAGGSLPFRPTIDGVYLLDMPIRRVLAGKVSRVPSIVGTVTDEGWLFSFGVDADSQFDSWVRSSFPLMTEAEYKQATKLYPAANFKTPHHRAAELFGDVIFVCPSELFSLVLAVSPASPTYRYRFNQTATTYGYPLVVHASDIDYVFNNVANLATDQGTQSVVASTQKFWVNFVNTANPNGAGAAWAQSASKWPLYGVGTRQQVVIQPTLALETTGAYMPDHAERCAFWMTVDLRIATHVSE